ncbi:MAG: phosphate ABC transporter substrate-binding protein [Polyangiaceae bacterium]
MFEKLIRLGCVVIALTSVTVVAGCRGGASHAKKGQPGKHAIQNIGSDTMVNLAQAWAEHYATVVPSVSIEVSGGGTGVGVAALINGTVEIANCSRRLTPAEFDKAKKATGKEPREHLVGYDGLAVFVHKSNPIEEISIEDLAAIYREGPTITKWSQLSVKLPEGATDEIVRVSRQNNSGTFQYFRETIVGKKDDLGLGSLDMNGSKEVVELIAQTVSAIGYSGLGYATPQVKVLKISKKRGSPSVFPSVATVHDKTYPISRPLYMYTPGEPSQAAHQYLAWILGPEGQSIVRETGYIPLAQ